MYYGFVFLAPFLVEAIHETETYALMDYRGSSLYFLAIFCDTICEPEIGIEEVECLN